MDAVLMTMVAPVAPALRFIGVRLPGDPPWPWTAARIARVAGSAVAVSGTAAGLLVAYNKLATMPPSAPSPLLNVLPPHEVAPLLADLPLRDACEALLTFARADTPAFLAVMHAAARVAALQAALNSGTLPYTPATPRLFAEHAFAVSAALRTLAAAVPVPMRGAYEDADEQFSAALADARSNVQRETRYRMEAAPRRLPA